MTLFKQTSSDDSFLLSKNSICLKFKDLLSNFSYISIILLYTITYICYVPSYLSTLLNRSVFNNYELINKWNN